MINSLPVCTGQAHTHSRKLIFYLMCLDEDKELTRNQTRLEAFSFLTTEQGSAMATQQVERVLR